MNLPPATLIPPALFEKPGKVLFITHLAIGDFAYMRNFLQALAAAHPRLEMHLWSDRPNRALDDWLAASPFLEKTFTPANPTNPRAPREKTIGEARAQNYPLVVSLAFLRPHKYARLARQISPGGFVTGITKPAALLAFHHRRAYKKLDAAIRFNGFADTAENAPRHITELYAAWFERLFGLRLPPQARLPRVDIPPEWQAGATDYLRAWGFDATGAPLVFINATASNKNRCWPMTRALALIAAMRQAPRWENAWFLLNSMPADFAATEKQIAASGLPRVRAFSANENFFQLPAMLAKSALVITVDTSVMHLAGAVGAPLVALMRRKKPEWTPLDIPPGALVATRQKNGWIKNITVDQVMAAIKTTQQAAT